MKYAVNIAGGFLGFIFIAFSLMILLHLVDMPKPDVTKPDGMFMVAFGTTGYLTFVKVFELIGGILVAIPKTRNLGLLVLGPIILNILAFHLFIEKGVGLFDASGIPIHVICLLALFLLWAGRKAFAGLIN